VPGGRIDFGDAVDFNDAACCRIGFTHMTFDLNENGFHGLTTLGLELLCVRRERLHFLGARAAC
jgi:hypothetical protein